MIDAMKQALELRKLADRFSEGWHDGIKIDASDVMLLTDVANAIEQAERIQRAEEVFAAASDEMKGEQAEKQEPYGYFRYDIRLDAWVQNRESSKGVAFYTAPPQREKQKPVAWANINKHGDITHTSNKQTAWAKTPLYTAPPQRQPHELLCVCGASWSIDGEGNEELLSTPPQRQPLTDGELRRCFLATNTTEPLAEGWPGLERFARAIERKHGIGGKHD